MKLQVEGIEEIEITDPAGLCNPPAPRMIIPMLPQQPSPSQIPQPFNPFRPQTVPPIYTRPHTKWGVGGPMIQQAGQQVDPERWEKNWNSGVGQPVELTQRSRKILRGEDPDGD